VAHASLTEHIAPGDAAARAALGPDFGVGVSGALEALNNEVTRQGAMIAYLDDFKLMMLITLACMPLLLFMRTPRIAPEPAHAFVD
jgi:DHA2 family multidrug resistance protein